MKLNKKAFCFIPVVMGVEIKGTDSSSMTSPFLFP